MNFKTFEKEDCIGEYKIYSYAFNEPLLESMLGHLSVFGDLKIFKQFPKPYFHFKSPTILIKGIIGKDIIEVTYFDYNSDQEKTALEQVLQNI